VNAETIIDLSLIEAATDDSGCYFCGSTPAMRRQRPGYSGCKVCAPKIFSDTHETMTAIGMAKLSQGIRYRLSLADGTYSEWQND
jgi:hypothetical protein